MTIAAIAASAWLWTTSLAWTELLGDRLGKGQSASIAAHNCQKSLCYSGRPPPHEVVGQGMASSMYEVRRCTACSKRASGEFYATPIASILSRKRVLEGLAGCLIARGRRTRPPINRVDKGVKTVAPRLPPSFYSMSYPCSSLSIDQHTEPTPRRPGPSTERVRGNGGLEKLRINCLSPHLISSCHLCHYCTSPLALQLPYRRPI